MKKAVVSAYVAAMLLGCAGRLGDNTSATHSESAQKRARPAPYKMSREEQNLLAEAQAHIKRGGKPDAPYRNGLTWLEKATENNHLELAKFLVSRGADVNREGKSGTTALQRAAHCRSREVADLLIAKGAKVDILSAAALGMTDRVKWFIKNHPKLVNERFSRGCTPIEWAGNREVAEMLIKAGAHINVKGAGGQTPLAHAVSRNSVDVADVLISHGADTSPKSGNYCLHTTAYLGYLEMARFLIGKGMKVSAKDDSGETPLHSAVSGATGRSGLGEMAAKFLIWKGADVNAKSDGGRTAADIARRGPQIFRGIGWDPCIPGHYREVLELLVEKGADVNAKTKKGYTPLHMVALHGGFPDAEGLQRIVGAIATQPATKE